MPLIIKIWRDPIPSKSLTFQNYHNMCCVCVRRIESLKLRAVDWYMYDYMYNLTALPSFKQSLVVPRQIMSGFCLLKSS